MTPFNVSSVLTRNSVFKQKLCDGRFLWTTALILGWRKWRHNANFESSDVDQKRVTQIIRISKMAALEQGSAIKFCVANKKSRQETRGVKTAFGNNAMKKIVLYKWYSKFEKGDNSVTEEPRPGRPSSISTNNKWTLIVGWLLEILQLGLGIP